MPETAVAEPKKKKLIRVSKHEHCPGTYKNNIESGFNMSLLCNTQKTDKNGYEVRERAITFSTCREIITSSIRAMANPDNQKVAYSNANQNMKDFDFEKLRLLIACNIADDKEAEVYKRRLFAGKRAVNLLENYVGWQPNSVIASIVSTETTSKSERYWILTGPGEWITTPQMFSLCTLILRMAMFCGEFDDADEIDTESVDSMLKHLEDLSKKVQKKEARTGRQSCFYTDGQHFLEIRKHILPILENHKKLFFKDVKDNYPDGERWRGYGGITSYVKCSTNYKELTDKFKALILKK